MLNSIPGADEPKKVPSGGGGGAGALKEGGGGGANKFYQRDTDHLIKPEKFGA